MIPPSDARSVGTGTAHPLTSYSHPINNKGTSIRALQFRSNLIQWYRRVMLPPNHFLGWQSLFWPFDPVCRYVSDASVPLFLFNILRVKQESGYVREHASPSPIKSIECRRSLIIFCYCVSTSMHKGKIFLFYLLYMCSGIQWHHSVCWLSTLVSKVPWFALSALSVNSNGISVEFRSSHNALNTVRANVKKHYLLYHELQHCYSLSLVQFKSNPA